MAENKLEKIAKWIKVTPVALSVAGLLGLVATVAFSVPVALAYNFRTDGPEWNTGCVAQPGNCNADETNWFVVSNSTQGTGWQTSLGNVKPGDVISFRVFMHNDTCPANDASGNDHDNCPATDAHNAYVHVDLPQNGGAVKATIGSDDTGSNVDRTVSLVLPSGQTIAYKAGSTQTSHNQFNPDTGWVIPHTNQVDGEADVITSGKLFQGDIDGCYSWSRYVIFQAVVSNNHPTPTPMPQPTPQPTPVPQGQVLSSNLPNTGPETAVELLLAGGAIAGVVVRKFRIR